MLNTVNSLRDKMKKDVGIYHHVEGCYTLLGPVPDGLTIGTPAYTKEGSPLLLRAIAQADAPSTEYELKFETIESVLVEQPDVEAKAPKKAKRKAPPAVEDIPDVDDTDVDSMT